MPKQLQTPSPVEQSFHDLMIAARAYKKTHRQVEKILYAPFRTGHDYVQHCLTSHGKPFAKIFKARDVLVSTLSTDRQDKLCYQSYSNLSMTLGDIYSDRSGNASIWRYDQHFLPSLQPSDKINTEHVKIAMQQAEQIQVATADPSAWMMMHHLALKPYQIMYYALKYMEDAACLTDEVNKVDIVFPAHRQNIFTYMRTEKDFITNVVTGSERAAELLPSLQDHFAKITPSLA